MYQLKPSRISKQLPKDIYRLRYITKLTFSKRNLSTSHIIKCCDNKTNLANSIRKFNLQRELKVISSGSKAFFKKLLS